ncbi:hypothetical protein GGR50DRAFT_641409 [Xylaria sp. CBS 124048]|nr:hypothetical protein GGR50DRAFT_641409 [Xylaria sp. CBS 124048]
MSHPAPGRILLCLVCVFFPLFPFHTHTHTHSLSLSLSFVLSLASRPFFFATGLV